ncbi:MAG: T9SS type A sorting domain-containing protein [Thermoflavifilum sp.]|nr:T9SS type A sorting domain-containing protein [Thermoflavifilum sp.]
MKQFYLIGFLALLAFPVSGQLLATQPAFIQEQSDSVRIIADAHFGNQGLLNYTPTSDVYVHIGVITNKSTSSSDWRYVHSQWGTTDPTYQCTYLGNSRWEYQISSNLRNFFGITDTAEHIQQIAILFRNGNGSQALRNADGSDMYIPVYDTGFHVRITYPYRQPKFVPVPEPLNLHQGDTLPVKAAATGVAKLVLRYNGQLVDSSFSDTLSTAVVLSDSGNQVITVQGNDGLQVTADSISFYIAPPTTTLPLPAGVSEGINYEPGDTSVVLVLYAPHKHHIVVIGDFNNWQQLPAYQMHQTPDSNYFWIRINGLTPQQQYAYQYVIDDTIKVADYNAHLILDPNYDAAIPASVYPNLKPYPTGKTSGIVSVLQTGQQPYQWHDSGFQRPDQHNRLIYELLVRDFIATHDWQTLKDTLSYLKRLGINTIELMPFTEFEGNDSWGYNPIFFFAPDKYYGPATALKQFIDACHQQGIAVIMDLVLNHAFGECPMVQMYWNKALQRPAADNPWFNQVPTHPFNVGYQFNHESPATQIFTYRVMQYWLTEFHLDGFRFDLAKGFTQKRSCDSTGNNCSLAVWNAYDSSRVAIWDTIYQQMQQIQPGSYCILEMFADNSEEKVYASKGMMLWGNLNDAFNQATMGYGSPSPSGNTWDFSWGIYTARGWSQPNLVTYQESHDEERLMYKNEQYGNSSGSYNIKDTTIGLKRNAMATAFWALIPGPKMMWQFGELGYDYSINTCTNGTVDPSGACRLADKPIRWDYLNDSRRRALFQVYQRMFKLRQIPAYVSTFTHGQISYQLSGAVKTMTLTGDSLDVVVVGNFDVVPHGASLSFPHTGKWYDYLSLQNSPDSAFQLSQSTLSLALSPGEYHVFVDRNVDEVKDTSSTKSPIWLPDTGSSMALKVFPNPANGQQSLQINYYLPQNDYIQLRIINVQGEVVTTLYNGFQYAGNYVIPWSFGNKIHAAGGLYFVQLSTRKQSSVTQKLLIP